MTVSQPFAYTTGTLDTISYGYGDSEWKDLLTSYDGQLLTSDEIGNLANDGTWSYTWQHGRQLAQMSRPDASGDTEMIRFRYDSGGHRIGKDSGVYHASYSGGEIVYAGETTRTSYSYLGDTLTQVNISAPTGSTSLHFTYDEIGPMSVTYDGAEYFYLKNAQGDVTGLVNSPIRSEENGEFYPGRPVTEEMRHDIRRIFRLLIDAGADRENRSAYSGKTIRQHYEGSPVWELCGDLFG